VPEGPGQSASLDDAVGERHVAAERDLVVHGNANPVMGNAISPLILAQGVRLCGDPRPCDNGRIFAWGHSMNGWQVRWSIAAVATACGAMAAAQPAPPSLARGELLYETHCVGCHTTEVHWRDRKLARDWKGLQAQVRRWQGNTGLRWSEQEIADVTRYLNGEFYHFAPPARQAQEEPPVPVVAITRR
jgi:hypothetical protein